MILAALALFLAAAATAALPARLEPLRGLAGWGLNAAAAAVCVVIGGMALRGHDTTLSLGELGGLGSARLDADRLSGLFLVTAFAAGFPALLSGAAGSLARNATRPRLPAVIALTLAAVLVVLTADHLFVLLAGWELLTIAFYLLTGYDRRQARRAEASVAAIVFGKFSGSALLAGGLLLAVRADSFRLDSFAAVPGGGAPDVAYALLLLGFGVKVGVVPVQVWLPPSYAAAPGPARAVMAGVAVNVGFYGMWRTLQLLGPPPVWLAVTVLIVAGVTAVLGITHAAVHPDLAGLVAWSSVENAGLITTGFGVALVGSAAHEPRLVAAGMLAATMQVVAHAFGKTLLFTATSSIEQSTGTTSLDQLRGITRTLPWSGTALVIGSLTLAGLPLTAGFASEWLTLESLMQQFRVDSLPMQLASAVAGALIALTVGVAGLTFVRLTALTAFSTPRIRLDGEAASEPWPHRLGLALLCAGCLGLAMLAPLEVRVIAAGLRPVVGSTAEDAVTDHWVIQPVYAGFSALSPSWLWIVLPAMTGAVALTAWVFSGGRVWRVRRVPAWSSASPGVDRGMGYTSFGYAHAMRKMLATVLLTRSQLNDVETQDVRTATLLAVGRTPNEEEMSPSDADAPQYRIDVVEVVEHYLYRPLELALLGAVRTAKRLQSGRLDAYMAYMLIALVAMLAVVTAMS